MKISEVLMGFENRGWTGVYIYLFPTISIMYEEYDGFSISIDQLCFELYTYLVFDYSEGEAGR